MRDRILSGFFCFLCTQPALADETPGLPFDEADDVPMVLSATRLNQSFFDVPAAVTVIDRQMIEQSGVREIPELLRMVPGMVVGYESGSEAFVSYHGTSADLARRMQVLVDGRSIYQPLLASVDWIGLPLELADIERIEVTRGPNAATYGVNSFFAVINIITRHPADVAGSKISYRRGENGIEDYHARFAQKAGQVDWRLSVAGRADDGFVDNHREDEVDFTDSKNTDSIYGRVVWSIDANSSLELSAGRARMFAQQQYREDIYLQVPVAERDNRFVSVMFDTDVSESHQLRIQASHSRFSRDEPWYVSVPPVFFNPLFEQELGDVFRRNPECLVTLVKDGKPSDCAPADLAVIGGLGELLDSRVFLADISGRESRTEFELQDTWVFSPEFRSVFGFTYDKSTATSTTYLGGREENDVWGLFGHAEWQVLPSVLLNVGGGQEFDKDSGDYFSPRAALNWHFVENQVVRLVYSEAVRTPDILETSANWVVPATDFLDPESGYGGGFFLTGHSDEAPTEKIKSSELGYFGRFPAIDLTADIRLFHDRMELAAHDIAFENFAIKPLESSRMRGGELALNWRPVAGQRLQLNYAHLDMASPRQDENTDFVPKHSGSVGWWQDYQQGWQFGTTYYFYNNLRNSKDKERQFYFDRVDARLAKRLSLPAKQVVEISGVIQCRLTGQPELREENVAKRHIGWVNLDWHF